MQNQERAVAQLSLVEALAANHRPGYSLDQRFYCDDEVFAADLREIVARKWIVAGHVDRVRRKGDYFLFKVGKESIIVVRSDENTINAFYNVCRHRGSVICTETARTCRTPHLPLSRLVLRLGRRAARRPAHARRLLQVGERSAPLSRARVSRLDLHQFVGRCAGRFRCHLRQTSEPYLDFHGLADAKIAHAESYPTDANWKLVVENFVECYHCAPSHPEFTSMHPPQALIAFGAGPSSGPAEAVDAYLPVLKAWEARAAALGRPIGTIDDGPDSSHLRLLLQRTIREGFETETEDGKPAAPLMGKRTAFDQGRMYLSFSPFTQLVATNDFAVLFVFSPRSTTKTDVDLYWLVDGKAREVDVPKMIWGWDRTTRQDKIITENNQAGIESTRYQPGRYSEHERRVVTFQQWYLGQYGFTAGWPQRLG